MPVERYLTDAFGERAVRFITEDKAQPFFLYLAFNAQHTSLEALRRRLRSSHTSPTPNAALTLRWFPSWTAISATPLRRLRLPGWRGTRSSYSSATMAGRTAEVQLFDLAQDASEAKDLSSAHADIRERLQKAPDTWVASMPAPYTRVSSEQVLEFVKIKQTGRPKGAEKSK